MMANDDIRERLARIETKLDAALKTLETHDKKIEQHSTFVSKAKGVFLAVQVAWGVLIAYLQQGGVK